jgi:hypothetical protein
MILKLRSQELSNIRRKASRWWKRKPQSSFWTRYVDFTTTYRPKCPYKNFRN